MVTKLSKKRIMVAIVRDITSKLYGWYTLR
jgi:hypothetical protein